MDVKLYFSVNISAVEALSETAATILMSLGRANYIDLIFIASKSILTPRQPCLYKSKYWNIFLDGKSLHQRKSRFLGLCEPNLSKQHLRHIENNGFANALLKRFPGTDIVFQSIFPFDLRAPGDRLILPYQSSCRDVQLIQRRP